MKEFSRGCNNIKFNTIGLLNKIFEYLILPKDRYYYDQKVVANLISIAYIENKFTISMNTEIDYVIYF